MTASNIFNAILSCWGSIDKSFNFASLTENIAEIVERVARGT